MFTGTVDWCDTVDTEGCRSIALGDDRAAMDRHGDMEPVQRCSANSDRTDGHWAGWLYATDADTGVWKWRVKSNYPIVSGLTADSRGARVLR